MVVVTKGMRALSPIWTLVIILWCKLVFSPAQGCCQITHRCSSQTSARAEAPFTKQITGYALLPATATADQPVVPAYTVALPSASVLNITVHVFLTN